MLVVYHRISGYVYRIGSEILESRKKFDLHVQVCYTSYGLIVSVFCFLVTKEEVWPINRDNRDFRGNDRTRETRVNERIRAREVRLIDENGEMIGVMTPMRALDIARERNLDIVEISPNAIPPVCKLMDYGKFKYEQAKKENEARKNQKTITLKEIRMRPRTDDHDVDVKTRKIQEFLAEGDKVRVSVQFRGAEMRHPDLGRKLLDEIAEVLKGSAIIERSPMMEGRMMSMIVSRAPGWEPPKKQAPATGKHHAAAPHENDASSLAISIAPAQTPVNSEAAGSTQES